jgi:replication factor C subunit 1
MLGQFFFLLLCALSGRSHLLVLAKCKLTLPFYKETTTATVVAGESGRDVIEFNASDVRSKKALQEGLGDITGSQTLEFRKDQRGGRLEKRTKRCIIMDEVDGLGAGDRSGIGELIQMIKRSRVPIICICNDRMAQKMKSLLPYCLDLRYKRPVKSTIANRIIEIARLEGMSVERNAIEAISESCGNDVRQVINCLQMWASNSSENKSMTYKSVKEREHSTNKDEMLRVGMFDAAKLILEGRRGLSNGDEKAERDSFFKRNDAVFVDYNFIGLLIQQNYLKILSAPYFEKKRANDKNGMQDVLDRMYLAAESMSDYAFAEDQLRSAQSWSLLPFTAALTVKAGYHASGETGGFLPGYPEFTTWLGRNSTKGKKARLLSEIQHHANYKINGGRQEIRATYLPVFRERLLHLLNKEDGVEEAIDLMDEYGLDRDDVFEKFDEFVLDNRAPTFAKIESKKKAAFTRLYNQRAHTSQALVAEQGGTTKRNARGGLSETVDPDAIDEDNVKEEESDEDEQFDAAKVAAMFKTKRRAKAKAPPAKSKATKGKKK